MNKKKKLTIVLCLVAIIGIVGTLFIYRAYCIKNRYDENLKLSKIDYEIFGKTIFTEYTNKNGKTMFTSNKYLYIMETGNTHGYAIAWNVKTNKCDYINTENGQILAEYNFIGNFDDDGYAYVKNANGKYGCINEEGKTIIEPKYNNCFHFYDEMAYVELDENENRKYGFINWNDEFIMEINHDINDSNDLIAVKNQDGLYGYVDITGKYKIQPKYLKTKSGTLNIYVGGEIDIVQDANGKWGMIDCTGKYVIEPEYDNVIRISDMIVAYQKNNDENKRANVCKVINYDYENMHELEFEVIDSENYIDLNVQVNESEVRHIFVEDFKDDMN